MSSSCKTIAVLGTLDSKGEEHAFVANLIASCGHTPLVIDVGTGGPPTVTPEITRYEVAAAGGIDLEALMERQDRGECVVAMSEAAPKLVAQLASGQRPTGSLFPEYSVISHEKDWGTLLERAAAEIAAEKGKRYPGQWQRSRKKSNLKSCSFG